MTKLEEAQKIVWEIYKKYCLECKKLETSYEAGLDGFKNYKEKKELTSKMLSDVNNVKEKYNIENLEISAKDLYEFEKKLFETK
jgi:hypothetical protein|nr:MAG TPA: hypothetical protein [Caudoviricetes sp.]